MANLKPCPFCGSAYDPVVVTNYDGDLFGVICKRCFASTAQYGEEKKAIEAWNRRDGGKENAVD